MASMRLARSPASCSSAIIGLPATASYRGGSTSRRLHRNYWTSAVGQALLVYYGDNKGKDPRLRFVDNGSVSSFEKPHAIHPFVDRPINDITRPTSYSSATAC
jgi:hypothetical protein